MEGEVALDSLHESFDNMDAIVVVSADVSCESKIGCHFDVVEGLRYDVTNFHHISLDWECWMRECYGYYD